MNTLNTQTTLKGVDMTTKNTTPNFLGGSYIKCDHTFKIVNTIKGGVFESPAGLLRAPDTLVTKCIKCNAIRHSNK